MILRCHLILQRVRFVPRAAGLVGVITGLASTTLFGEPASEAGVTAVVGNTPPNGFINYFGATKEKPSGR